MNRRINKCIDHYLKKFKDDITKEAATSTSAEDILQIINQYPPLTLSSTDYEKRKRAKNIVPLYERCTAKRANNEQCTRRRRENSEFCGTHIKGTPHGVVNVQKQDNPLQKVDVWLKEINGINYYIDDNKNVYDPQDVFQNKINPRRIHTYSIDDADVYTIHS